MKINEIKYLMKNKPDVLIKKPLFLLYLPFIAVTVFLNNLKFNIEKVYFVETQIEDYLKDNSKQLSEISNLKNFKIINIKNYNEFESYLNFRIKEDSTAGINYRVLIEKRFSDNVEAFVITRGEEPLGYIFLQKRISYIPQVKTNLLMPSDTFTFIDLYIYKKYRGKKYHEFLYTLTIKYLNELGYNHFWCWLMKHNQISIKAHVKLGISNVTKIITRKSFLFFSKTTTEEIKMDLSSLIENQPSN